MVLHLRAPALSRRLCRVHNRARPRLHELLFDWRERGVGALNRVALAGRSCDWYLGERNV